MRFPILVRFALVAGIAVLLLLPLAMIQKKIGERRDRAARFRPLRRGNERPQALAGPFLALRCEETYVDKNWVYRRPATRTPSARRSSVPARRHCSSPGTDDRRSVPVEGRYRGIYPIRLYRAKVELSGTSRCRRRPPRWARALRLEGSFPGARDQRCARNQAGPAEFTPGTGDTHIRSGLHSSLGSTARLDKQLAFRIPLELAGTGRLEIARSAARTTSASIPTGRIRPSSAATRPTGARSPAGGSPRPGE
jgi:inner membrane protein involved in colicin E2 resistance